MNVRSGRRVGAGVLVVLCASLGHADIQEARELFSAGRLEQAGAMASELIRQGPGKVENRELLVDILISQGRFDQAIAACEDAVSSLPEAAGLRLTLARVYSWRQRFSDSVRAYDGCIAAEPKEPDCWIEKARVLGWAKRYDESLAQYRAALALGGVEWLGPEMSAKEALWDHRVLEAERSYVLAVATKPDNGEALMDLAQLYSNSGMYRAAEARYARLLEVNPYHTAATRSRAKNSSRRSGLHLSAGMSYWHAESSERQVDVDRVTPFATAAQRLADDWTLSVTGSRGYYRYHAADSVAENGIGGEVAYSRGMRGGASARFGWTGYEGFSSPRAAYGVSGWVKAVERLDLSLAYGRENLNTNRVNMADGLYQWTMGTRGTYDAGRHALFGADYKYGHVSDDSPFHIAGADAQITFLSEPHRLYSILRFETWNYAHDSSRYFAPRSYQTYSGLVGYKHNFGSEGLYYGALERYADLQFRHARDSHGYGSVNPKIILHADLTRRLYAEASASLTDSHYYKDRSVFAVLGLFLGRP
ncbi:MAG: tetratricopeptide repeat protein [Elusimicrobiota bacterium]